VDCSQYADITSFVKWLYAQAQADIDIVASVVAELGRTEMGRDYDQTYTLRRDYSILTYKPDKWGLD
jgi:hypothetical protein